MLRPRSRRWCRYGGIHEREREGERARKEEVYSRQGGEMNRIFLIASTLLFISSCEGCDDDGETSAPDDLVPVLDALCELTERCEELPPIASQNREECVDILYWLLTCRMVEENDELVGIERVALQIDEEGAEACADFINGLACEDFDCMSDGSCPEGEACLELFGAFGDDDDDDRHILGEECSPYGDECVSGLYCREEYYDEEAYVMVCAACEPQLEEGDDCVAWSDVVMCGAGLVCIQAVDGSAACEPLRVDGEACTEGRECESEFCGDGSCSSGGFEGDTCETRAGCRWEELTCIDGVCTTYREIGETCGQDDHCRVYECDETDSRCGLADGSSCFDSVDCRSGFCDPALRDCAPKRADREPCSTSAHEGCESGYCDGETSLCAPAPPPQPEGGACVEPRECEEGLLCDSVCYRPCDDEGSCPEGQFCGYANRMMCMPLREDGSGCEDDEECLSGFCNDGENCGVKPGIGDPCSGWSDCYPQGYCSGGVCVERRGPNQSCESYDACLEPYLCLEGRCTLISLSCEPASDGEQCTYLRFCDERSFCDTSFRCRSRRSVGQPCSALPNECEPGLYCSLEGETALTCQQGASSGEPCAPDMPCVDETFCVDGLCIEGEGGEPCNWHEDCPSGTFCNDRSERCEPARGEGDECDDHDVLCQEGLYCSSDYPQVCIPPRGEGDECDGYGIPCSVGLYCNTDDYPYACVARPGLGEPCEDDTGCEPGAVCSASYEGTCIARVGESETCETNHWYLYGSNCLEGLFCEYGDSDYVCFAPRELGESCGMSEQCASGICAPGVNRCATASQCVMP